MDLDPKTCPVCGVGTLVEHRHERKETLDGRSYVIGGLLHSICDRCNERVTTPDQSRHNKHVIAEARAQAVAERDRAQQLKPADILRIRKKLGLTQAQAARVFGGGANAFSKYENGEVEPSDGMEKLLRLAGSVPAAARWLLSRAGLPAELIQDPRRAQREAMIAALNQMKDAADARLRALTVEIAAHSYVAWGQGTGTWSFMEVAARAPADFTFASDSAANDPDMATRHEQVSFG